MELFSFFRRLFAVMQKRGEFVFVSGKCKGWLEGPNVAYFPY